MMEIRFNDGDWTSDRLSPALACMLLREVLKLTDMMKMTSLSVFLSLQI